MEKKRIVWIDWAKAIGIMIVVLCHTPHYKSVIMSFFESMQMPLFFLISGYLHKCQPSFRESFFKYFRTLFIPYLLFQIIFYPYYVVRMLFDGQSWDFMNGLILPLSKVFLSEELDGPTWFLYALFVIKIIVDVSIRVKESILLPVLVAVSFIATYYIWGDDILNINFCIDSLIRFVPFYILGYWLKRYGNGIMTYTDKRKTLSLASSIMLFVISVLLIQYASKEWCYQFPLFFFVGTTGSFVIIELCKILPEKKIITQLSSGTIIILGLHWMFIGATNVIVEKFLHIGHGIIYPLPIAFLIVFYITLVNYYIFLFCKAHFNIILGGRS